MFTGGNPILLGVWINLEDMGPCTEDGLLSVQRRQETEGAEGRDGAVSKWLKPSTQRLNSLKYVQYV